MNDPKISLTVVAPLYNEEESVTVLYQRICQAVDPLNQPYEIIFVDDGSSDSTFAVASELATKDHKLRVIAFRKNYGQTPAMAAGIDNAKGKTLITMDGDLQNDPSDIPMMVNKLNEGYDIVVGWRHNRQDKLITRKIPSMIANKLIGAVTGVPIRDNGCSLKVYRAEVMQKMPFYNEMHRFIPALLFVAGSKVAEVKVKHHARQFGESKYGLSRIYKVLLDLLTIKTIGSIAHHPTLWFAKLALLPLLISFMCMIYALIALASGDSMLVMSTVSLLFFILSMFLISLGFLGELIYKHGSITVSQLALLTANQVGEKIKST